MITNSSLTIYHKVYDEVTRLDKWKRYNYEKVWFFGGKGASVNKGYDNANDVDIRTLERHARQVILRGLGMNI